MANEVTTSEIQCGEADVDYDRRLNYNSFAVDFVIMISLYICTNLAMSTNSRTLKLVHAVSHYNLNTLFRSSSYWKPSHLKWSTRIPGTSILNFGSLRTQTQLRHMNTPYDIYRSNWQRRRICRRRGITCNAPWVCQCYQFS